MQCGRDFRAILLSASTSIQVSAGLNSVTQSKIKGRQMELEGDRMNGSARCLRLQLQQQTHATRLNDKMLGRVRE